jgi:spermidine synthase
MLSRMTKVDRRLLILGGGDGYIAATALSLNPSLAEITVVDLDKEVVNACRSHLKQTAFDDTRVNLVVQDALQLMDQQDHAAYDGIICDLTDFPVGYDDAELRGFYDRVFELSTMTLKSTDWISIYADSVGCFSSGALAVDMLTDLLKRNFQHVERRERFIPSFGESSNLLYGNRKM